jgi:hypothetical protein
VVTLTVADAVNEVLSGHQARQNQAEALMRQRISPEGANWSFLGDIPRSSITVPKEGNALRTVEGLKKDKIDAIAARVSLGEVMPAVIVTRKGRVLIEGFHRYHGYDKAGNPNIPAYEVDFADAVEQEQFIIEITQMAGDKLHPEEAKKLALSYLQRGFSEFRIAGMLAMPLSTLRQWAAISKLQARLKATGNNYDLRHWSNHMCGMVLGIRNLPSLIATVDLINDAGLKSGEAAEIIKTLRAAQSQAEELQILQEQREVLAPRIQEKKLSPKNAPSYIRPIWMQSLPALSLLTKYEAEFYIDTAPDDQVARLMKLWAAVAHVAEEVIEKLSERHVAK